MKKTILFTILTLLGITQIAAQEYEYVPFVREGVKWVYHYEESYDPFSDDFMLLNLELKGDTVINGKTYKLMHKYHGETINTENDTIPVCLREENKVVYAFVPNGVLYPDCPVGNHYKSSDFDAIKEGREFVLYDFNNPIGYCKAFSDSLGTKFEHLFTDIITIGKHHVKRYGLDIDAFGGIRIIEGVGMETWNSYPLSFFWPTMYGMNYYKLIKVIEDGEVIYDPEINEEPNIENHEYVPFVREGVKWVYYYKNPFSSDGYDMPSGKQYFSFEMKGDVLIGDKHYKPVILTHYFDKNGQAKKVEDFIPVYLREENKEVYAIHPDGFWHAQCPVGYGWFVTEPSGLPLTTSSEEFKLYDFNDPMAIYSSAEGVGLIEYYGSDLISIGGQNRKCHHYKTWYSEDDKIIDGIGYDGISGFPLYYFYVFVTGLQVTYYLSHVIENGEIIYKGMWYDPDNHVSIEKVEAEQPNQAVDGNYYNLMGQPVGKQLPQTPGIYIHNGKKICVGLMP